VTPAKNLGRVQHRAAIVKREKSQPLEQRRAGTAPLVRRLHHHSQHARTVVSTHMRRQGQGVAVVVRPTLVHLPKAGMWAAASVTQARLDRTEAHARSVPQEDTSPPQERLCAPTVALGRAQLQQVP
jgi:hypothetical protein